jgi:hypothetical protein
MPVSHQNYHEKSYINWLSVFITKNLIFIQIYCDGSKTGQGSFKMCWGFGSSGIWCCVARQFPALWSHYILLKHQHTPGATASHPRRLKLSTQFEISHSTPFYNSNVMLLRQNQHSEGTTILKPWGNITQWQNITSHPTGHEPSTTMLWKPLISQFKIYSLRLYILYVLYLNDLDVHLLKIQTCYSLAEQFLQWSKWTGTASS